MSTTMVTVHGERAADLQRVLGTTTVRVLSPVTRLANLPGFDEPQPVYELDLDWVRQLGRVEELVTWIAERFEIARLIVEGELDQYGMPILAKDCTMVSDDPSLN